jgi:hypothetical protein
MTLVVPKRPTGFAWALAPANLRSTRTSLVRARREFSMMSNDFWYGFILGVGLVFLVFFLSVVVKKARKTGE